jgi:hypothetical protein
MWAKLLAAEIPATRRKRASTVQSVPNRAFSLAVPS